MYGQRSRTAPLRVGGQSAYYAVAFSPDGRTGRVGGSWTTRSCASGTCAPGSSSASSTRAAHGALTLDFSPDGRILAVSGFEPVASLWDVATGVRIGPTLTAGSRRADDRPLSRRAAAAR